MKAQKAISILISAFVFMMSVATASATIAAPLEYHVAGMFSSYLWIDPELTPEQYPLPLNTTFSGNFFYDSSIPLSLLDQTTLSANGAVSNFSGTLGGHPIFSATQNAGALFSSGDATSSMFSIGLTDSYPDLNVNNNLIFSHLSLIFFGTFSTTQLPGDLTQLSPPVAMISYKNSSTLILGTAIVSQVPLPPTAFLFASGVFALAGRSLRCRASAKCHGFSSVAPCRTPIPKKKVRPLWIKFAGALSFIVKSKS